MSTDQTIRTSDLESTPAAGAMVAPAAGGLLRGEDGQSQSSKAPSANEAVVAASLANIVSLGKCRVTELERAIQRVAAGDVGEAIRQVVEEVTEEMMVELAFTDGDLGDLQERMIDAKYRAFKKATGREFTTIANRVLKLRKEIRAAKGDAKGGV